MNPASVVESVTTSYFFEDEATTLELNKNTYSDVLFQSLMSPV
jgi:hypothetical protein